MLSIKASGTIYQSSYFIIIIIIIIRTYSASAYIHELPLQSTLEQ